MSLKQSLIDTLREKTGGRKKGTPNKVTSQVKEKLSLVINKTIESVDISDMSSSEKIKLIQIGLQYLLPKLQHTIESNNEDLPLFIEQNVQSFLKM